MSAQQLRALSPRVVADPRVQSRHLGPDPSAARADPPEQRPTRDGHAVIGMFVESTQGNDVIGRLMPYPSTGVHAAPAASPGVVLRHQHHARQVSAAVSLSVTLIESSDRELLVALRTRGYRVDETSVAEVASIHPAGSKGPDAFLVDTRALRRAAARPGRAEAPVPGRRHSSCSPSRSTRPRCSKRCGSASRNGCPSRSRRPNSTPRFSA